MKFKAMWFENILWVEYTFFKNFAVGLLHLIGAKNC